MTVSRFLRNPEQVSVALRGRLPPLLMNWAIFPIAAPDILSNATSRAIGVLLPSLTNQVFAEVLRGIESVTDAHGYQTMLAHYGYKPEMEQERLESMLSWNIDGLILTERTHTPRTLKMIEVAGIPVVELMDSKSPCLDIAVGFDNFEAARQMTAAIIAPRASPYCLSRRTSRRTYYHQTEGIRTGDAGCRPGAV
ncbi:gluconate utilization system GNT-I transcriptional repressor [Escherichia coli]|nr:gluconate utilization system GNT-I transcriptional repressor [Escherichia coli]